MTKRTQGYTLIELLIVTLIFGILITLLAVNYLNAQVRAKVAQAEQETRSLHSALEAFFIDNNQYPYMGSDPKAMNAQYPGLDLNDPSACRIDSAHLMIGNAQLGRRLYLTTPAAYISPIPYDLYRGDGNKSSYGYGSNGQSYYILTSFGPDNSEGLAGVKGGELNESQYTGVNIRNSKFSLNELRYDPSNGIVSTGDSIHVGP